MPAMALPHPFGEPDDFCPFVACRSGLVSVAVLVVVARSVLVVASDLLAGLCYRSGLVSVAVLIRFGLVALVLVALVLVVALVLEEPLLR